MSPADDQTTPGGPPRSGRAVSACSGCGLVLPEVDGPIHPYMTSSAACWATYGRILAAQYTDPERMRFHQLVVDTYAVQHPGMAGDSRAVRSVGIHLMTLCLFLEHGTDVALGTSLHRRMVERPVFQELAPPARRGSRTCADVPVRATAGQVREAVFDWARQAWEAWSMHHDAVRAWLTSAGLRPG